MTKGAEYNTPSKRASDDVAEVLSALGQLMRELRNHDLALQNAVSELATDTPDATKQLVHIQHIDLITQTHDDLARFLPELAACLHRTKFDENKLGEKLRLQSLKDHLLEKNGALDHAATISGELSLF